MVKIFNCVMDQKIIERILSKVKIPNLVKLLVDQLSFSELQTLLLKIIELKSEKKEYVDLLNEFKSNKFANPSDVNPLVHRRLELDIFSLLPDDFELIDLSPMTPLGTSSVLATVHQNNVISTIRNLEVASDTTNILSLECAKRRNELFKRNPKSNRAIKLCSSQRCTRAQPFENKNFSACFNVAALCTAGRDEGNRSYSSRNRRGTYRRAYR